MLGHAKSRKKASKMYWWYPIPHMPKVDGCFAPTYGWYAHSTCRAGLRTPQMSPATRKETNFGALYQSKYSVAPCFFLLPCRLGARRTALEPHAAVPQSTICPVLFHARTHRTRPCLAPRAARRAPIPIRRRCCCGLHRASTAFAHCLTPLA